LRLGTDATPVTLDSLPEKLIAEVSKNPDLKLAISADTTAPWGKVVKVMDATKMAKLTRKR
jgi:biopolymer transport protein ExbD